MTFEQFYINVIKDCAAVRGIAVSKEDASTFLRLLKEDGYTVEQLRAAKSWILRGNWTYKKVNRLELSDFYPSLENLKSVDKDVVFMKYDTFTAKIKTNYERGYNDGLAEANEFYKKRLKEIKNEL